MAQCRSQRGFVLIVTCIVLAILMGLAGLGIDIGRMYVIKSELQAFSDAAALNAALCLNGSEQGIARARKAAVALATGPRAMKWDMGTQPITEIAASFASVRDVADPKAWQAEPRMAIQARFVQITVSAPAPLIFLRALPPGFSGFSTVSASSVATNTERGVRLIQ